MPNISVYEKPTCTTCRKVAEMLIENGVDFEKVNYYIDLFPKTQLQLLLKKMNMNPSELLRKTGIVYENLNLKARNFSENQILDLMIKHPRFSSASDTREGQQSYSCPPTGKNS
jgi:arsenate reductase (glutaredoxin)